MAENRGSIPLTQLLGLVRPYRLTLLAAIVALLIGTAMGLIYPQVIRYLIDGALLEEGGSDHLNQAIILMLFTFVVHSVFTFGRAYLFNSVGERVVADLRVQLYEALMRQDVAFFDENRTGDLTNRLASDTTVIQNTVTSNISMGLRFGLQAVGGVGILIYTSPALTLVMLAVVPAMVLIGLAYGRTIKKLSKEVQDALAASNEVAEETFAGVRTVKSFAREASEEARYRSAVSRSLDLAIKRIQAGSVFGALVSFGGYASIAVVLWYGGRLVIQGELTVGTLTAFVLYTLVVAFSLGAVSDLWGDFMKAIGASERVFELMARVPGVRSPAHPVHLSSVVGEVELRDIQFSYPSRADQVVLNQLNLKLRQGEKVALVGPSGGGKSTIAALIPRFYDPQQGSVLLDGVDVKGMDPEELRGHIGAVSQEPILFATSILENIRYGRPQATDQEVEAAARAANAHTFITSFPEGYQTMVGERGVRLSGGQKQRVAIARAILKDPRVLILDEATSALDAESEHLVKEALERLMEGRTTLIIAHRLSTVLGADHIVVLDGGAVVQQGNHQQLMAEGGLYRMLVERQLTDVTGQEI